MNHNYVSRFLKAAGEAEIPDFARESEITGDADLSFCAGGNTGFPVGDKAHTWASGLIFGFEKKAMDPAERDAVDKGLKEARAFWGIPEESPIQKTASDRYPVRALNHKNETTYTVSLSSPEETASLAGQLLRKTASRTEKKTLAESILALPDDMKKLIGPEDMRGLHKMACDGVCDPEVTAEALRLRAGLVSVKDPELCETLRKAASEIEEKDGFASPDTVTAVARALDTLDESGLLDEYHDIKPYDPCFMTRKEAADVLDNSLTLSNGSWRNTKEFTNSKDKVSEWFAINGGVPKFASDAEMLDCVASLPPQAADLLEEHIGLDRKC